MRFVVIDRCPVPRRVAPVVRILKAESGATLNSCYRGDKATSLLKRLGKSTQSFLYRMWVRHVQGFNPANPPGFSTHELHSDGVAYRGPRGRPLAADWKVGMDWSDTPAVIRVAERHGWHMFRPYPSGSEFHHLNFKRKPKIKRKGKR